MSILFTILIIVALVIVVILGAFLIEVLWRFRKTLINGTPLPSSLNDILPQNQPKVGHKLEKGRAQFIDPISPKEKFDSSKSIGDLLQK